MKKQHREDAILMEDTTYSGGYRDEIIFGTSYSDQIWGGFGDDTVYGKQGDDMISDVYLQKPSPGAYNDDHYFGGAGDDFLSTISGADTLDGGAGGDVLWCNSTDAFVVDGGAGRDTIHLDASISIMSKNGDNYLFLTEAGNLVSAVDVEVLRFHDW